MAEPFNPWREACGFYPPDIVGRQKNLRDGIKRLYERLVRYAGRDGACFPSQVRLADDLGKTDRQIRNDLQKLEIEGLIRHRFRDGRKSNTYEFLFHKMFLERKPTSAQNDGSDADVTDLSGSTLPVNGTGERKPTSAQGDGQQPETSGRERKKSVDLSGSGLPPNSVQELYPGKSSSSGSVDAPAGEEEDRQRFAEFMCTRLRGTDCFGDSGPDVPKPPRALVNEILALAPDWTVGQIEAGVLMQATVHGTRKVRSYNWFKIAVRDAVKACGGTPPEPIEPVREHVDGDNGLGAKLTAPREPECHSRWQPPRMTAEEAERYREQGDRWAEIYQRQQAPIRRAMDKLNFAGADMAERDQVLSALGAGTHPVFDGARPPRGGVKTAGACPETAARRSFVHGGTDSFEKFHEK